MTNLLATVIVTLVTNWQSCGNKQFEMDCYKIQAGRIQTNYSIKIQGFPDTILKTEQSQIIVTKVEKIKGDCQLANSIYLYNSPVFKAYTNINTFYLNPTNF